MDLSEEVEFVVESLFQEDPSGQSKTHQPVHPQMRSQLAAPERKKHHPACAIAAPSTRNTPGVVAELPPKLRPFSNAMMNGCAV